VIDQSLKPQWEPVKNINGAEGLILKFQQKKEEEEREKRKRELKVRFDLIIFSHLDNKKA
jgi:hypothetical protein